jgi:cell division septation protein DedD
VVILLGGAGLAGYFYGLKHAVPPTGEAGLGSAGGIQNRAESKPSMGGTQASVTFYSELKEPRKDVPSTVPPRPVESTRAAVEAKPAAPPASASGIRDPVTGRGSLMLQVASYKDQANAQKLLQDLSAEGYTGTVVRAELGERGLWFRVRIGPYSDEGEAERVLKKLRDERKLKGYIVK